MTTLKLKGLGLELLGQSAWMAQAASTTLRGDSRRIVGGVQTAARAALMDGDGFSSGMEEMEALLDKHESTNCVGL